MIREKENIVLAEWGQNFLIAGPCGYIPLAPILLNILEAVVYRAEFCLDLPLGSDRPSYYQLPTMKGAETLDKTAAGARTQAAYENRWKTALSNPRLLIIAFFASSVSMSHTSC